MHGSQAKQSEVTRAAERRPLACAGGEDGLGDVVEQLADVGFVELDTQPLLATGSRS